MTWCESRELDCQPQARPAGEPAGADRGQLITSIFRSQGEFVWRVVRRLGVPDADAEDAVQEVFLVVASKLDAYEERGALRAWLVAIARQVAQRAYRTRFRRERKAREFIAHEVADDPQRALENTQAAAFVNEFLAELDHDQAVAFYLAELEGMTAPEIAAGLQVNLNTVYGRLRVARKHFDAKLKRKLDRERRCLT